jgi:hypothetical protein
MSKNEKKKGGKAQMGVSVIQTATEAVEAVLGEFHAAPHLFSVFTVSEDMGVAKKGVEYVLKVSSGSSGSSSFNVFVDRKLLSKDKLVVKMPVGGRVIIRSRSVTTAKGVETIYIAMAPLP